MKRSVSFLHAVLCVGTHCSATPDKIRVGSIICWGGVSQGRARLAGSSHVPVGPVRALEIKGQNSRGTSMDASDFDLPSTCHAQLGLCSSLDNIIDSLLYFCQALKNLVFTICVFLCFAYRGRKTTALTLASLPSVHHKRGECTLIQSIQIRT